MQSDAELKTGLIISQTMSISGCIAKIDTEHRTVSHTTAASLLNPVHTSNNVEPTFDIVAKNGNNVERVLR